MMIPYKDCCRLYGMGRSIGTAIDPVSFFKPKSPPLQAPGLIPVPAAFLHGSLLLSKVGAWVVGPQLLQADTIFVPPSFLAGWAGLVTAALNALPLGSSDGGRACTVRCGIELPGLM